MPERERADSPGAGTGHLPGPEVGDETRCAPRACVPHAGDMLAWVLVRCHDPRATCPGEAGGDLACAGGGGSAGVPEPSVMPGEPGQSHRKSFTRVKGVTGASIAAVTATACQRGPHPTPNAVGPAQGGRERHTPGSWVSVRPAWAGCRPSVPLVPRLRRSRGHGAKPAACA